MWELLHAKTTVSLLPPSPPPDASPSSKPVPHQVRNASGQILHEWRGAKFLAAQALVCFVLRTWKWSGLLLSPSLVIQVHILCNTTPAEEYSKLTSPYWIVKSPPPRQIHTQTSYIHTHRAVKGMEAAALRLTLKAMEDICSHISLSVANWWNPLVADEVVEMILCRRIHVLCVANTREMCYLSFLLFCPKAVQDGGKGGRTDVFCSRGESDSFRKSL